MPLQEISKGTGPNTGTGTDARTAADILKNNFEYLEALILANTTITISGFAVKKASGNTNLTAFEDDDTFEGWLGNRYFIGKILDASALTMPVDIEDDTKVILALNS